MSGKIHSQRPEALLGRRPGGHTSGGLGGPRLPVRSYGGRGGAPSRTETRAPAPGLPGSLDPLAGDPGPRSPALGPGRPQRASGEGRGGGRAGALTRSSRGAPAVKFTSGPWTLRGLGAAKRNEAARGGAPGHRRAGPLGRRRHPGLATPTFCLVAELEVSGLCGRWARFQQRRLSLATKRESRPERGGTKGKGWRGLAT